MTPGFRQFSRCLSNLPKRSLRRLLALAVLVVLGSVSLGYAKENVEDFLRKFEKQRGKITTYSARFVQKKSLAVFNEQKVSTGVVLFKAPHQMIWKYETPDKTQMRVVGEEVSFYFPELRQIEKYPPRGGSATPFFFAFEATADEIKRNFEVSVSPGEAGGLIQAKLAPKSEQLASGLQSITLWLEESDYLPRKILISETSGDTTMIELSKVRVNEPIADKELKFDAPEGTPVIEADSGGL